MTEASEKKQKIIAVSGTLAFHALLFLLFILMAFKTPIPPFPENTGLGIEVDFGNLVEGTGNVEDDKMGNMDNSKTATPQTNQSNPEESNAILTNDAEEASINIKKVKEPKKREVKAEEKLETKEPEEKPSSALAEALAVFKKNKNASTGGGDGKSGNPGNAGDPNGVPDGNGDGGTGGDGRGTNYSLKGRLLLKKPEIVDDSQEEGKVIVEITVDETGKVIKANPGARGSTTTSALLYAKARQAAFGAKFNASAEGAKEQKGTITFVFILN